jgi:hypothetical protein
MHGTGSIPTAAKELRGFEREDNRMITALERLERVVGLVATAFEPVLMPQPTTDSGCDKAKEIVSSPYQLAMERYIDRLAECTNQLENICQRSEI